MPDVMGHEEWGRTLYIYKYGALQADRRAAEKALRKDHDLVLKRLEALETLIRDVSCSSVEPPSRQEFAIVHVPRTTWDECQKAWRL